jgi:phosphatidylglycerophosphatase C
MLDVLSSVPADTAGPRPVVAAFDVDGTLTVRDCVVPFLREVGGRRALVWSVVRRPGALGSALVRRDRDRFKAMGVDVLRDRRIDDVATSGTRFARHVVDAMLRADTLERLRWHQAEGHWTVLVSASLRPYLASFGAHLGVDAVMCCDLEVGADRRFTGRLSGPNCRGDQKVRRLEQWLTDENLCTAELWAYGDSSGDRALLDRAEHPHLVGRTKLERLAVPDGTTR